MTTNASKNITKLGDELSVRDQDAVGDDSTNDTAAITAALAISGTKYLPKGIYKTTLTTSQLTGPFKGQGQIRDSSNNKHAPNMAVANAAPATLGNPGSIDTVFNGDVSKMQFPVEHRITGASSAGTPTTGYTYVPEVFPHVTFMRNDSGWNQSTSSNDGRTGVAAYYTNVEQYGQGDAMCYVARAQVYSTKAGSTDFLANPAGGLFAGDCVSGIAGAYLNPIEINCIDNNFDSAAVGAVFNMYRNVNTSAKKAFWNGVRIQSFGSKAIEAGFVLTGLSNIGLDFARTTLTDFLGVKAAIALKDGDCIVGGVTAGTAYADVNLTNNTFKYTADSGWTLTAGNNPSLQVKQNTVVTTCPTSIYPTGGAYLTFMTDATHVYLGNNAKGVTVQCDGPLMFTNNTQAYSATGGAASALPAAPATYLRIKIDGTIYKVPCYNN